MVIMEKDQGCLQNQLKPIHSSGEHYSEVLCTHLDASGAVQTRFSVFSQHFARFWGAEASRVPEQPSGKPARPAESEDLEDLIDFGRNLEDLNRNLKKSRGF